MSLNLPGKESLSGKVALLGIPTDENSSFIKGCAEAPKAIRAALYSGSTNLTSEAGTSISHNPRFLDIGDMDVKPGAEGLMRIEEGIEEILSKGAHPLILGGDHAITYPIMLAVSKHYPDVEILHFDAHPDLYDIYEENSLSHACPFARIAERQFAKRIVQIGIRTLNEHQRDQANRFGVEIHEMRSLDVSSFSIRFNGPVYLSFDMDALDPAFAPGVSHFEPGGLSVRDVITIIQRTSMRIIGADIVEYNPRRDFHDMTAMVAVKLIKEISDIMLRVT
ncbi:MAG: agmatinase [Deltaproteobacteria bacterium]|nr:agmatinase [Deltaproteobacteria bacterium]MBW2084089.1 agmatinase [Deltaproteobacteria bacterium]HDM08990.1 agmatinase [Desulfobacteraceae bacterium]